MFFRFVKVIADFRKERRRGCYVLSIEDGKMIKVVLSSFSFSYPLKGAKLYMIESGRRAILVSKYNVSILVCLLYVVITASGTHKCIDYNE